MVEKVGLGDDGGLLDALLHLLLHRGLDATASRSKLGGDEKKL